MARAKTPKQLAIKLKSLKKQMTRLEQQRKRAMAANKKKPAKRKAAKRKPARRKKARKKRRRYIFIFPILNFSYLSIYF